MHVHFTYLTEIKGKYMFLRIFVILCSVFQLTDKILREEDTTETY